MSANPVGLFLRHRHAGPDKLAWANSVLQAPESFELTSPAFAGGAPIPERYRGRLRGQNVSPELSWTRPPATAQELVLLIQDPDVPFGNPATHGISVGIDPFLLGLPENGLADPSPIAGLRHGRGALGHRGYAGPLPIRSHGPHAYVFQLFALDSPVGLAEGFTLRDAVRAMAGHVVARASLKGTYEIS